MKPLSATAAAKLAHKSKKDILEAINTGDMSATKNGRGHWQIDPSELNRVFPYEFSELNQEPNQKLIKTASKTNETSALHVEVNMLREQLSMKDEIIDDLKGQRDSWEGQAKQLLLSNQNQPTGQGAQISRLGHFMKVFTG